MYFAFQYYLNVTDGSRDRHIYIKNVSIHSFFFGNKNKEKNVFKAKKVNLRLKWGVLLERFRGMEKLMSQIKFMGVLGLILLLPQTGQARSDLWVKGNSKTSSPEIEIPSLAPLVKARESAVLVVYTVSEGPALRV